MNSLPNKLVIATRESRLALWQAEYVQAQLQKKYPTLQIELLKMTTKGDQILDRTLSKIGGKGLFIKELEAALLDGRADLAVHSLKDVPMELNPVFQLACIMKREDPRDAFVSNRYNSLDEMPKGAIVGTASLRRESQIRAHYPNLVVNTLRGNLDTRLRKLDEGQYDAIILAAAGLKRLQLEERIKTFISTDISLPAAGQGALGIEILSRRQEVHQLLQVLSDTNTTACVTAERATSAALGGSCQVPLAAYATLHNNSLSIDALVADIDGSTIIRAHVQGSVQEATVVGEQAADILATKGAQALIDKAIQGATN